MYGVMHADFKFYALPYLFALKNAEFFIILLGWGTLNGFLRMWCSCPLELVFPQQFLQIVVDIFPGFGTATGQ